MAIDLGLEKWDGWGVLVRGGWVGSAVGADWEVEATPTAVDGGCGRGGDGTVR